MPGFTRNRTPFLPPNSDYFERNVAFQRNTEISNYNMFKDLSALRKTDILKYGSFKTEAAHKREGPFIMKRLLKYINIIYIITYLQAYILTFHSILFCE